MSFNRAWIPAVAGIALILGCDSKPADKIPTTAPTAIMEPHEVLQHLQYMAVRKDMKHTSLIVPVDPDIIHGSAWWFNKHAGDMGNLLHRRRDQGLRPRTFLREGLLHRRRQP